MKPLAVIFLLIGSGWTFHLSTRNDAKPAVAAKTYVVDLDLPPSERLGFDKKNTETEATVDVATVRNSC